MTVKIADNQTPAQCTLRVAEEGERAQLTVAIAESGDRAQMTVTLENYTPGSAYAARVLALTPIAYYQLAEASGTTATDSSGNAYHGAYTNAVPGGTGMGDSNTGATFDGTGDSIDIHAMAGAFNGNAGSLVVWGKTSAWGDSALRALVSISTGGAGTNQVWIMKSAALNTLTFQRSDSNDDVVITSSALAGSTAYFCAGLTWSVAANAMKAYINGVQVGATATGLVSAVGTPTATTTTIGASNTSGADSWSGSLAHVAIFDRALSGAEVLSLGVL